MLCRITPPPRKSSRPDAGRGLTPWLLLLFIPVVLMLLSNLRVFFVRMAQPETFRQDFYGDFAMRWAECRYLLHGINPMDAVRGLVPPPESGMALPAIAGAFPWAYTSGVLLTLAFLPYPAARAVTLVCLALLGAGVAAAAWRLVFRATGCRPLAVWSAGFTLCFHSFYSACFLGNYGYLCGLALIAAVLLAEKRPAISGLLLILAAAKPQLAALFYLALLLDKKWRPVLTGALGTLLLWLAAAFACRTSPLVMLYETFSQSTSSFAENNSFGLFTGALPRTAGMLLSMLLCTLCMAAGCLWLLRQKSALPHWKWFYYSLPAVFSVGWTYCNSVDHSVLYLLFALILLCFWDVISEKGMRLCLFLILLFALFWMLCPALIEGCIMDFWVYYFPGEFLDRWVAGLLPWAPFPVLWVLCLLCASPGKFAERFRAML